MGRASPRHLALPLDWIRPPAMLALATARGVEAVRCCAEALPFAAQSFDHALVVTTICFVDSPPRMLAEASRGFRPG